MKTQFQIKVNYVRSKIKTEKQFDTWQEVVDESIRVINYSLNQFPPSDEMMVISLYQDNDILRQHTLITHNY